MRSGDLNQKTEFKGGNNVKTLIVSTVVPERKYASWIYISSIVQNISKYSEVKFWFSILNENIQAKNDFIINTIKKNLLSLKLKSFLKNYYVAYSYHREHLNSLEEVLKSFQPDVVVFANLPSASYLHDVKKNKMNIYTVLLQHNVEYVVVKDLSKYGRSFFHRIYYDFQKKFIRKFERKIMSNVDFIISISPSDKEYFVRNYGIPADKVEVIRPIFEYEKNLFNAKSSDEKNISFISSFNWYPNVEGAIFFVKNVLPKLLRKFPKIKLYLVGRDPEKRILELRERYPENVIVTGTVESVETYYRMSNCVVIPIFIGPGIKLKVLEAMASGVPTVMTSYVARDYDLLDKGFCIADRPEEFVHHIERILEDHDYARIISKRQIEWYESYLSNEKEKIRVVLERIFSEVNKKR